MADSSSHSEADNRPDPLLTASGWERRFVADPTRAREATELYRSLGFEVHAEPVKPVELGPECTDCQLLACSTYVTIYTRKT